MKIFLQTIVHLFIISVTGVTCELFTSVDELSRLPKITKQLSDLLSNLIQTKEAKLNRMRHIREKISNTLMIDENRTVGLSEGFEHDEQMQNPVIAFVTLNRLVRAIDGLNSILEDHDADEQTDSEYFTRTDAVHRLIEQLKQHLPEDDDLTGSGEALLRLQTFYDLKLEDLIYGKIRRSQQDETDDKENEQPKVNKGALKGRQVMQAEDCFELGRIAFLNDQFSLAIQWLYKSLEMCTSSNLEQSDYSKEQHDELLNNVLEYMAFCAYKLDLLEYSAKLTQAWLERDQQNERARDNLQYYLEELNVMSLGSQNESDAELLDNDLAQRMVQSIVEVVSTRESDELNRNKTKQNTYTLGDKFSTEKYSVTEDAIVRELCRNSTDLSPSIASNRCRLETGSGMKVEMLNKDPKIIRLHDIVTPAEAKHLKQVALDKLQRSTIHSSAGGYQTSDFRIAKTAWISGKTDPVVKRIEDRLRETLDIQMEGSEDLQIVNYGLGGFYGPHLDSARSTSAERNDLALNSSELQRDDRYATILIYLNHVESGGSTVFPKLNVAVRPIERSAVVWFNLRDDGLTDERTLHTGCPVLLGSKWIATKWPREAANSFSRPCKRRRVAVADAA